MQEERQKRKDLCVCGAGEPAQNAYKFFGLQDMWLQRVHKGGCEGKGRVDAQRVLQEMHEGLLEKPESTLFKAFFGGFPAIKQGVGFAKACLCQVPKAVRKQPLPPEGCNYCGCSGIFEGELEGFNGGINRVQSRGYQVHEEEVQPVVKQKKVLL